MAFERIYTIPIRRKAIHAPRWKRAKKASSVVKEFLFKHTKHNVAVSNWINEEIWARGSRSPPSRIRVRVFEREGKYLAELVELPKRATRLAEATQEKEKILSEKAKKIQEQQEAITKEAEKQAKEQATTEEKKEEEKSAEVKDTQKSEGIPGNIQKDVKPAKQPRSKKNKTQEQNK